MDAHMNVCIMQHIQMYEYECLNVYNVNCNHLLIQPLLLVTVSITIVIV